MIPHEVKLLARKEWRQLRASGQAMATSVILPVLFLGLLPQLLVFASVASRGRPPDRPLPTEMAIGFVGDIGHDPSRLAITMLPLFLGLAGLTVPTLLAIHAVVSERESRTLELMIALPIRVGHLLAAKLLTVLLFALAVCGTLLSVTSVELLVLDLATPLEVLGLYAELTAAIAAGSAGAIAIGFQAHDFRTAQNVSGAVVAPMILVSIAVAMLTGGGAARPFMLACFYGLIALVLAAHALRRATYEKLLR